MFPTEFSALIAWQHQTLFRKTHSDGTLARHCHWSDKTHRMPGMSCCAVTEGSRYQTPCTAPLKAGVNQGFGHRAAAFSSLADGQSCLQLLAALNSVVDIYLCGRNLHFLASQDNTEVWQQLNFFLKEEVHRWTQQLWLQTNSQRICSKTLLQQWTTHWLWNISWCNSRQTPCILSVKREQIWVNNILNKGLKTAIPNAECESREMRSCNHVTCRAGSWGFCGFPFLCGFRWVKPQCSQPGALQSLAPAHGSQSGVETAVESSGLLLPKAQRVLLPQRTYNPFNSTAWELLLPFYCYSFYNWKKRVLFILCVYLAALLTSPDHRTGILLWN